MLAKLFGKKKQGADQADMSFLEHIDALRSHLFRSAIYVAIGAAFVFTQKTFVFDQIILGPLHRDFITYKFFCQLSEMTCFYPENVKLITKELSEQFVIHFKVSFFIGLIIAFPFVFREFWAFVKPGLHDKEIRATSGVIIWCTLLFLLGVLFGYFVLAPFSISFLASYNVSGLVEATTTLGSYVDAMTMYTMSTGLVFELPMVVYFLAKLGIMSSEFMKAYRRHAIVIIVIVAAIITPPDVTSMMAVTVPLMILYQVSIYIAKVNFPKEVSEE